MTEIREVYPQPKPDRRLVPNLPERGVSRRNVDARYVGRIPVAVRDPQEKSETFSCSSLDLSLTGMLLHWPAGHAPPSVGEKFTLSFYLPPGLMPEGYEARVRLDAEVARVSVEDEGCLAGLRFEKDLDQYLHGRRWRRMGVVASGWLLVSLLAVMYLRQESVFYFVFDIPVFLYGMIASIFLISRFALALFYRNTPVDPDYTPGVSLIIPCFNEEEWIEKTLQSGLNQDYPQDKLEVILVDDGSTDGSMRRVRAFAERVRREIAGDRLIIIEQPRNMGKRHAMAAGALRSRFDLLIFVDSDSFLEPNAVREIVQPFKIPEMGAVSGRTEVQNKWTNALTKMQAVRYYVAFRFFKAAEAVFDAVTCLSGPLACYRKHLVLKYLDAWLNQTFMGHKATFGDDRSLTNFILQHARTGYQDSAVCSTIVPSRMKTFIRQQMRWKRSWLRETLRAGSFMWRKEPFMALSFYIGFILPILAPLVVLRTLLVVPLMYGIFPYTYLVGVLVMSMLMSASYLFLKRSNLWLYGIIFCLFYLAVLLWQLPAAIFTFWKSEWGTRSTFADVAAGLSAKNSKASAPAMAEAALAGAAAGPLAPASSPPALAPGLENEPELVDAAPQPPLAVLELAAPALNPAPAALAAAMPESAALREIIAEQNARIAQLYEKLSALEKGGPRRAAARVMPRPARPAEDHAAPPGDAGAGRRKRAALAAVRRHAERAPARSAAMRAYETGFGPWPAAARPAAAFPACAACAPCMRRLCPLRENGYCSTGVDSVAAIPVTIKLS